MFRSLKRGASRPPTDNLSQEKPAAGCARCQHFCNDPRVLEREFPGLAVLSSAHAAVRAQDGLCQVHQRLTSPHNSCAQWQERASTEA